jgi:hypothetical protein
LARALRRKPDLAKAVVAGTVMLDGDDARFLLDTAREVAV